MESGGWLFRKKRQHLIYRHKTMDKCIRSLWVWLENRVNCAWRKQKNKKRWRRNRAARGTGRGQWRTGCRKSGVSEVGCWRALTLIPLWVQVPGGVGCSGEGRTRFPGELPAGEPQVLWYLAPPLLAAEPPSRAQLGPGVGVVCPFPRG